MSKVQNVWQSTIRILGLEVYNVRISRPLFIGLEDNICPGKLKLNYSTNRTPRRIQPHARPNGPVGYLMKSEMLIN